MSVKSQARRSFVASNNHLGGAMATKKQRRSHCLNFIDWCFQNNMPVTSMKNVTFAQVQAYLQARGLPPRDTEDATVFAQTFEQRHGFKPVTTATLHNILGSIRRSMRALGADPCVLGITSQGLGLPSKSRLGKKHPITDERFIKVCADAQEAGELGFVLCLKIERYFGHRGLESLMSPASLQSFVLDSAAQIQVHIDRSGNTNDPIEPMPALPIKDGTKGGLARHASFIAKYLKESLLLIQEVMEYLKTHTYLIEGKSAGLKSARARYGALARKFGLTGQTSPHALRYRYTVDKLLELRDAGITRKEAFELCSNYLGHRSSRGRWVRMVYGRSVADSFPATRQRRDFAATADLLNGLIEQMFPASASDHAAATATNAGSSCSHDGGRHCHSGTSASQTSALQL